MGDKRLCLMCETLVPTGEVEIVRETNVCRDCAELLRMPPPNYPEIREAEGPARGAICGWCGMELAPDDRGLDHESCVLARPGRELCMVCGRRLDLDKAVNGPEGYGLAHSRCVEIWRLTQIGEGEADF